MSQLFDNSLSSQPRKDSADRLQSLSQKQNPISHLFSLDSDFQNDANYEEAQRQEQRDEEDDIHFNPEEFTVSKEEQAQKV